MSVSGEQVSESGRGATPVQRLARAVRATDWWAVMVELAVVVLGILIAFELTEWDQRRQDRAQELLALQHIEEEAAGDLAALERIRNQHQESVGNFVRLIAAARSGGAEYNRAGADNCNLLRVPAVRRPSAGAGGLAGADRLALISDHRLRDLLRSAEAERVFAESQIMYFRDAFGRYAEQLDAYTQYALRLDGNSCRMDVEGIRRSPVLVGLLPMIGRDQQRLTEYRDREVQATRSVRERVRCLRTNSCRPDQPD
jgi:hypothetical protein